MKELIVIQHCQSEQHINKMAGGWADWKLTEKGQAQAKAIGEKLRDKINPVEYKMFSSDLLRASETAQIAGRELGLTPVLCRDLREINIGEANGKPIRWLDENRNTAAEGVDLIDVRSFHGAENTREHYSRIAAQLDALKAQGVEKAIIVTHGGSVPFVIAWWLKLPAEFFNTGSFVSHAGSITYLGKNLRGLNVLRQLSDTAHLSENLS